MWLTWFVVCRATLDLNLRHIGIEHDNMHEKHSRDVRSKDADLRKLKKSDLQLKVARENLEHIRQMYEKKKAEVRADATDTPCFFIE
jgi:hypothetical protein